VDGPDRDTLMRDDQPRNPTEPFVLDVLTLADENFALPLAVLGRSILDHIRSGIRLRITVVDGGISAESRDRVTRSWDEGVEVRWCEPLMGELDELVSIGRIPPLTFARLRAASMLPPDRERVVVLDADQLVLTDMTRLFEEPFAGATVIAPRDVFIPTAGSPFGLADGDAWGVDREAPFFCAALMVIDLRAWRDTRVEERAVRFVMENASRLRSCDQDALNVVLAGKWRPLDTRWQVQPRALELAPAVTPQFSADERDALRREPWVVHFSGRLKPWLYRGRSRYDAMFRETQSRTEFRDQQPDSLARDWFYRLYDGPVRRHLYPLEIRAGGWLGGIRRRRRA
jgi:lipopolysaccharide biosynthesis glycosyltransferase